MRSLGGYYFARAKYAEAIPRLQKAIAINPLLSRSWFILGCACVRTEDWETAVKAFTRCVSIDDEDGESWSNLASVYLRISEEVHGPGRSNEDDNADVSSSSTTFLRVLRKGNRMIDCPWGVD